MSWQEELRRIDGDLAAGRLSKEQYAVRREELLAEASSAPITTAQREPVELEIPPDVPASTPPPVPAKDLLTTDRQTTAPSPADERSTDSMPHPPRRQAARAPEPVKPSDVPPPVPQAAQRPAAPQRDIAHAPPPLPGPPADKPRGAVPTWTFLALGVLIVAALVGGGLWWLTSGDEPDSAGQPSPPSTTEPAEPDQTTEPADPADELPQLPGVLNRNSGTFSPADGAKRKLYGEDEALLLKRQGVREVTWKGSSRTAGEAAMAYVILVAENPSRAKAESTARVLRDLSRSRVPEAKGLDGFEQLPTFRKISKETNVYRVIYNSGSKTVRVGVVQTPGTDQRRLTTELSDLLRQVTELLPPDKG